MEKLFNKVKSFFSIIKKCVYLMENLLCLFHKKNMIMIEQQIEINEQNRCVVYVVVLIFHLVI